MTLKILLPSREKTAATLLRPLDWLGVASLDTFDPHRSRHRASPAGIRRSFALLTEPDESVTLAALQARAEECRLTLPRPVRAS